MEGEGLYCLLCKKYGARNLQNKTEQFATVGSARCKVDAIIGHQDCAKHKGAMMVEVLNKISVFQKICIVNSKINSII